MTKKDSRMGTDILSEHVLEGVERHAKNTSKDLIQLMQINKKFIKRVCTVLIKRIMEPSYTAE